MDSSFVVRDGLVASCYFSFLFLDKSERFVFGFYRAYSRGAFFENLTDNAAESILDMVDRTNSSPYPSTIAKKVRIFANFGEKHASCTAAVINYVSITGGSSDRARSREKIQ